MPFKGSSQVEASDRLSFVFDLIGADAESTLKKAKEMGLTGDDLGFIEEQDVETLLQSSLQRRKLMAVTKYLKNGGKLTYQTTMADIYECPTPAVSMPTQISPQPHASSNNNTTTPTTSASSNAPQSNNGGTQRNWLNEASTAFHSIPSKLSQIQKMQKQIQSIIKQFSACLAA